MWVRCSEAYFVSTKGHDVMQITSEACEFINDGSRNWPIVQVTTDTGLIGIGEAYPVGPDKAVAETVRYFEEWLVGFDPFVSPDYARQKGIELLTLEQLLAESDFITLHTPLTDGTRHMIGAEQVGLLKPGARLILSLIHI